MRPLQIGYGPHSRETKKAPESFNSEAYCGMDGTRTRDPLRDRQVF